MNCLRVVLAGILTSGLDFFQEKTSLYGESSCSVTHIFCYIVTFLLPCINKSIPSFLCYENVMQPHSLVFTGSCANVGCILQDQQHVLLQQSCLLPFRSSTSAEVKMRGLNMFCSAELMNRRVFQKECSFSYIFKSCSFGICETK